MPAASAPPNLLVLDASYTLEMIRERGLEQSVTCRDLDGFFGHVWSVHPFATLLTSPEWAPRFGKPVWTQIDPKHTFVEGKVGRFKLLARLFPLNFLFGQIGLFFALWRLIRRENIKAVRVGDPLYLGLFGLLLSRLGRIPLVIRVNGNNDKVRNSTGRPIYPQLFRSVSIEKLIEKLVFPHADLVAAPNQDNVDFSIQNGARVDRVTIFRYGNLLNKEHLLDPSKRGIDRALFEKLGVTPGGYLLCIGRLQSVKFPDDTLRVLIELRMRGYDLKLVMAGDGPMREKLEVMARENGVADSTIFAGNQNQRQLSQLIPRAAAIISPLTGRALSEAALGAAAIVAYDLDWQSDLIQTGETGELVPFRQWQELANSAERLLSNKDYARQMGQGARARALETLDPEKLNQHERDEYSKLLARK